MSITGSKTKVPSMASQRSNGSLGGGCCFAGFRRFFTH
jgi:hypothetical protein